MSVDRTALRRKYGDERIKVVDADLVKACLTNQEGFIALPTEQIKEILDNLHLQSFFMPRYEAEYNPEFRQFVLYCLVQDSYNNRYFVTRRINNAGDSRLDTQYSLGTGGHVNDTDEFTEGGDWVWGALVREIYEELDLGERTLHDAHVSYVGLIHSNATEVDKDHLGVVVRVNFPGASQSVPGIQVRETDKLAGEWMSVDQIKQVSKLETWSQFIFDAIVKGEI